MGSGGQDGDRRRRGCCMEDGATRERCGSECHEVEVCKEAGSLWSMYSKCNKNPGHSNFIPVGQFGLGQLPLVCRNKQLVSYLKLASRFTVRLLCKFTSLDRPVYYPCGNLRGTKMLRLASGFAWVPNETTNFPCPIPNCPYDKKGHNVYGYIRIITSKHVVYDMKEAIHTRAQFFFDSPRHPERTSIAQCVGLDYSLEDNDVAHIQCVTHDPTLCSVLREDMEQLRVLYSKIPPDVFQNAGDLCVAISHPHGMSKMISLGKHKWFEVTMTLSHAHYHNAPTCPGSSGAPVYYICKKETGNSPMWLPAVHSFHCLSSNMNCAFK